MFYQKCSKQIPFIILSQLCKVNTQNYCKLYNNNWISINLLSLILFTMYNVHCILYTVLCTVYNVQCAFYDVVTIYDAECTLCNIKVTLYSALRTLYNYYIPGSIINYAMYIVYCWTYWFVLHVTHLMNRIIMPWCDCFSLFNVIMCNYM